MFALSVSMSDQFSRLEIAILRVTFLISILYLAFIFFPYALLLKIAIFWKDLISWDLFSIASACNLLNLLVSLLV